MSFVHSPSFESIDDPKHNESKNLSPEKDPISLQLPTYLASPHTPNFPKSQMLSPKPSSNSSSIVKLNIGGYKYYTTKDTLCGRGENFFSSLLSGRVPATTDDKGFYFIDRDGKYFAPILEYLRTGEYNVTSESGRYCVQREAEFYSILLPVMDRPISAAPATQKSTSPLRHHGVYFSKQLNTSYSFGFDEKGIYNMFNNFSVEFSYTMNDNLVYISFDKDQKQKKSLLFLPELGALVDPTCQEESLQFYSCNELRESTVYEGNLDISKEGRSRNLVGMVFGQNSTVYLNIAEEEPPPTNNIMTRSWKKGTYKITKFLHLSSLAISIPLDSLSIEILCFGSFLAARIRRNNNFYFVFFHSIQGEKHSFLRNHDTFLPSTSGLSNVGGGMSFGKPKEIEKVNPPRVASSSELLARKLNPVKSFRRSTSFSVGTPTSLQSLEERLLNGQDL